MASSLRVNAIVPASGTNVAIGTAGGTITYAASVSGVSTFSNGIIVAAGTTAAPSISPSGDSNTGIFFPSADTIAFGEGGVEAARFDSNGRLGIGTQIPSAVINVRSSSAELARFTNTGSNGGDWEIKLGGGGFEDRKFMLTDKFGGTDNVRLSVDGSGRITKPYQPVFKAYRSASTSGAGVIVFNNVVYNVGSSYSNSTGLFTAPISGYYIFFFLSIGSGISNTFRDVWGSVNGTTTPSSFGARPTNQTADYSSSGAASNIVYLNTNDTFGIYAGGSLYSDTNFWLQFGGYLLG